MTMVAGIATQAAHGYYRFEIPLYLRVAARRSLRRLPAHRRARDDDSRRGEPQVRRPSPRHPGVRRDRAASASGLEHNLFQYRIGLRVHRYSDMNGWGPYVWPFFWWKLYWGAFARAAARRGVSVLVRGEETGFAVRTRLARGAVRPARDAVGGRGGAGLRRRRRHSFSTIRMF